MKIKSLFGRVGEMGDGIAPRFGPVALGASLCVLSACSGAAFSTFEEYEEASDRRDASSEAGPLPDGGNDGSGDAEGGLDASSADADASDDDAEGGDAEPSDAGELDASDDGDEDACVSVTWYLDEDGDGWGGTITSEGCAPPSEGKWVEKGGDCHDENDDVHPGQTKYFAVPYTPPGIIATESFDYDCSGHEQGDGKATTTETGCKADLTQCRGSGYLAVNPRREGDGLNHFCGSTSKRTCSPKVIGGVLGCNSSVNSSAEPLRCR